MQRYDEYHIPSKEQELHSPREQCAPAREEYPLSGSEDGIPPRGRTRQRRIWLYVAVVFLAVSVGLLREPEEVTTPPNETEQSSLWSQPVSAPTAPAVTAPPATEGQPTTDAAPTEPPRELTDAEILLSQGTWETGTGLSVHFDAGGGWWSYEGMVGIMQWKEDSQGHVGYSGYACYKAEYEPESGPRIGAKEDSCAGTVYVDRSAQPYTITLDNPFSQPQTVYHGAEQTQYSAALAALYEPTAEQMLENSRWQLSALEGNEERLAQALEDSNPYNRAVIWISALRFEGENAVVCFSDIYGGSKEFLCTYHQIGQFEFLLTPVTEEALEEYDTPFKYPIEAPEGGQYSLELWGYPNRITCRIAFGETGLMLLAVNPFASWLYQDDVCILSVAES